jgi:oxygen-dependent protoporphyrinogen oxidase
MQEGEGQTSADVVVGAGIAGLTVARDLAEAGRTVTVIEASERTGGLVRPLPVRRRGEDRAVAVLDAGAEAMGVRRPEAIDLVAELGLQIEHPAARSWVQPVHHGGSTTARPIPSRSLLGIPSDLSDPLVADILGTRAAAAAAALDASVGPGIPAGASLADVVRTRLGNDVLELLVRPIAGALHAADPADLMVDSVAPGLASAVAAEGSLTAAVARLVPAGPLVATIVGGMHRLPVALEDAARAAGARILVDSRVESLSPDAGGWLVRTAGGEEVRTGQVVLAATGRAAVRLLSPHVAEAADLTLRSGAPVTAPSSSTPPSWTRRRAARASSWPRARAWAVIPCAPRRSPTRARSGRGPAASSAACTRCACPTGGPARRSTPQARRRPSRTPRPSSAWS